MLRKFLVLIVLLLPLSAHAKQSSDIGKYLIGTWKVEGIKKKGSTKFRPPPHPIKWTFTRHGIFTEAFGNSGAKINWQYHVVGHDIKVKLGHMAFTWRILGMEDKVMLIQHQAGLYKIRHM